MSSYTRVAWHPVERVARAAAYIDDYFGQYSYGVIFEGDPHVYRPAEVEIPLDLVLAPEMKDLVQTPSEQVETPSGHPLSERLFNAMSADLLAEYRNQIIEECAKLGDLWAADAEAQSMLEWERSRRWSLAERRNHAKEFAAALRSLKASAPRQIEEAQRADTASPVAQHLPDTKITGAQ
jgi:hypothetical protein